ncbi:IS1 family transposase [Pontibacter beigongshangensis]|uniref:IS1 family transposase n=1 Tax=Pontibacter beigongshangensis TaxID=2574733 RepID=UPI001650B42A
MCEILIKINCPHCQSSKVVKNGKKRNGEQNLLCRSCGKQFQGRYRHPGADPAVKQLAIRLLERNSGIRDIEELLGISRRCILDNLCRQGTRLKIAPARQHYQSVQIDEVWSFVGKRKKGKYWLLYAYSPEADEILAYSCGSRSASTVRELLKQLEGVAVEHYYTDHWKAFAQVLPPEKHTVGKAYTKNIEGVNTCLRARNRRLVRKTTCFSKKKENHLAALNLMFSYRNKQKAKHHTF